MKAKRRTLGVLLFLILLAGGVFALLTLLFWAILCGMPGKNRLPVRPQMEPFCWRQFRAMT